MKKFISVVLTVIMVGLMILLCINLAIRSMATQTVSNAIVAREATNQIEQIITNNFPNVTDEQVQQVQEAISNSDSINSFTNDLLQQLTEDALNNQDIDTNAIMNQLAQVFVDNVTTIEQVIGQDITDDQVQLIKERLTDENGSLSNHINQVVESVTSGSSRTESFLKSYQTVSSLMVRIGCIIGIIVCIVLIGLINRSFYQWAIYAGIGAIVGAIIVGLFLPLVVSAVEFTIGQRILAMSITIPSNLLRIEGIVLAVIGIVLIVGYLILKQKYPKYQRNYY
ncbi:hypothetical protein [uncultured Thomasclavelia sp.]|uniref:hypothetical protein n=1 Tax=uncultured Thomasclavelia sp. TaxID=3025759 RepID=UPI0025D2CD25|nr:hypothetical protein [uncultured Thomasclavelia sp.]